MPPLKPFTAPSNKLPKWECRTRREAKELTDWTNAKLDEEEITANNFISLSAEHVPLITIKRAKAAADNGDVSLLRRIYPELAKYLHHPQRKVGRPRKQEDGDDADAVREAKIQVKLIRQIWKSYFGKMKRPQNDIVTAERIAHARCGVSVEAILGRHRKL